MTEDRDTRLKRLRMRSWHRGIKEMDMILGRFADEMISSLSDAELDAHEIMMAEQDHDLYMWVLDRESPPDALKSAISRLRQHFLSKNIS
ncbi:MAG: succinate dehydrogenase assembly factor 2 [Rhodobacterales bacterium]